VVPEKQADGHVRYQAASPDEGALVAAARELGVAFVGRSTKSLQCAPHGLEAGSELSRGRACLAACGGSSGCA
jgi:phospholipid-transporting ATPase